MPPEITPEIQALIDAAVQAATEKATQEKRDLLADLTKAKAVKAEVESLGGLDTVKERLAEIERQKTEAERRKEKNAIENGRVEELQKIHAEALAKRDAQNQKLRDSIAKKEVQNVLLKEITAADGIPEILTALLADKVSGTVDDDGNFVLEVKGFDGSTMNKDGKNLSVSDLVSSIKENPVYGGAFKASVGAGSGAKTTGTSAVKNPWIDGTVDERVKISQENPALAADLKAQAGKS